MSVVRMFTFTDKLEIINREIAKRKHKWQLKALSYMDFDDVAQILRIHIHKKWDMWHQDKPLKNWVNTVITRQISNLIRNHYGNVAPPCYGPPACKCDEGGDRCSITPSGQKCDECPLYKKWTKKKRDAYYLKLASSTDDPLYIEHQFQAASHDDQLDYEGAEVRLHEKMRQVLTPYQWSIYDLLYIKGRSDAEVAELKGYKTTEKNRSAGYKQLHNIKKVIMARVKSVLAKEDIV
jgi:DNA-directed RNA polymerase specialized sigma24 family protein